MLAVERWAVGMGGGLLVALALSFVASALGVELAQTGSSRGKWLFFAVWGGWLGYCLLDALPARALALSIGAAGCLAVLAGVIWLVAAGGVAGLDVELGLWVIGLGLCEVARRLMRATGSRST